MANAPIDLSIAIHYWTRPDDYPGVAPPACRPQMDAIGRMLAAGVLEVTPDGDAAYKATEAMGVYIEALLAVPYPVQKWVMP